MSNHLSANCFPKILRTQYLLFMPSILVNMAIWNAMKNKIYKNKLGVFAFRYIIIAIIPATKLGY